jgi:uncharacterized protein (DUF58 family)
MAFHFVLLTFVLLMLLQAVFFRKTGLMRIRYDRRLSTRVCHQDDEIEMVETIENRKWLPVPWLRVESQIPAGLRFGEQANLDISSGSIYQNHKSLFSLMPYTRIIRRHAVKCAKRGYYRADSVSMTAGDLFGIVTDTRRLDIGFELVVCPKPLMPEEWDLPTHSWMGEAVVRRWIVDDPFLIAGTREYRYGDPLKGINWKASARTGRLQVHKRDHSADHRLLIVLNVEDHEGMWSVATNEALVDYALSLAAGMARYAAENGLEVGFAANAAEAGRPGEARPAFIAPDAGQPHLHAIYESMGRLKTERLLPLHELLQQIGGRLDDRTDIAVLTTYENVRIAEAVRGLEQRGHAVRVLPLRLPGHDAEPSASGGKAGRPA